MSTFIDGNQGRYHADIKGIHTIVVEAKSAPVEIRPVSGSTVSILFSNPRKTDIISAEIAEGRFQFHHTTKTTPTLLFGEFRLHRTILLEIPDTFHGNLLVCTSNGRLKAERLSLERAELSTTNGGVILEDFSCESAVVSSTNGALHLTRIAAGTAEFSTTNGGANAQDLACKILNIHTTNGGLYASRVSAPQTELSTSNGKVAVLDLIATSVHIKTSNGRLEVQNLLAEHIDLETSNAPVTGTIKGDLRDYAISSHTSNAPNNLPNYSYPDQKKLLSVHTCNGKIDVQFIP